jgi:hypothetical protein
MYTPFTGPAGLVAPLVSVGRGRAADFAGLDVRGKVVVIDAAISSRTMLDPARVLYAQDPAHRFARPVEHVGYPGNFLGGFADRTLLRGMDAVLRASEAGASGFIMILDGHAPGIASLAWPYDGVVSRIPGFYVPAAHGAMVRAATAGAEGIRLRSEGLTGRGSMRNIIAVMPGRSPRAVIVGSHHDAPGRGVIEDATGTVAVLALAKAWSRLPPMERPCTVVFALCGGHFARGEGAYRLAAAYPQLMDGARAVLVLEHLAGREVSFDAAGGYAVLPTRQPSTLYVSPHPEMAAIARLSLEAAPQPPVTVEQPLLGIPLTDVAGYVAATKIASTGGRSGLPYISWISAPPYLVDEGDQRDKLDPRDYMSALAAAEEMLRRLVALPESFNAVE